MFATFKGWAKFVVCKLYSKVLLASKVLMSQQLLQGWEGCARYERRRSSWYLKRCHLTSPGVNLYLLKAEMWWVFQHFSPQTSVVLEEGRASIHPN
jgi:hypothetical protein